MPDSPQRLREAPQEVKDWLLTIALSAACAACVFVLSVVGIAVMAALVRP